MPGFPAGFLFEDGELVEQDDIHAVYRVAGVLPPSVQSLERQVRTAQVPAGVVFTVHVSLDWSIAHADLELEMNDEEGSTLCASTFGSLLANGHEACSAGANPALAAPEAWTVGVIGFSNPQEVPYTLLVELVLATEPSDLGAAPHFGEPLLIGTGAVAEAWLHIKGDTMLACSHGSFAKTSPVWARVGDGPWKPVPIPGVEPTGDCDLAITDDGTWYVILDVLDTPGLPAAAHMIIARSADQGATWTTDLVLPQLVPAPDRPWLLADGDDITMLIQQAVAATPAVHLYARSTDQGQTWIQTPMDVTEPPERINKVASRPIHSDGSILAAVAATTRVAENPPTTFVQLHRSDDDGLTWQTEEVLGPLIAPSIMVPALARADDTLYLTYATLGEDGADIHVLWSMDNGATWSAPLQVTGSVGLWSGVLGPAIDARPDGSVTVAWMDRIDDGARAPGWQVAMARVDAHAEAPLVFSGGITEPVESFQFVEFISVQHDDAGRAHIAFLMEGEGCEDGPERPLLLQCMYVVAEE